MLAVLWTADDLETVFLSVFLSSGLAQGDDGA
jgi:hypothetical protein